MAKSFNARMRDRFIRITTNYQKINDYVHETAVMIAKHAKEHNDCSTAQGLVMAMPASARREMLILWFKMFTPIVVKNDDKWTAKMHKEGTKLHVPFNIEEGKATPFWKLAEENKEKAPLSIEALLKLIPQLVSRVEKSLERDEVEESAVPVAKTLIAKLSAVDLPKAPAANDKAETAGSARSAKDDAKAA